MTILKTKTKWVGEVVLSFAVCLFAFAAEGGTAGDDFASPRAEFNKYYRAVTGKAAREGLVTFAIDPNVSRSGADAYTVVSKGEPPVTITGSNLRSVLYGVYDLLERRGGCRWFWDGDVIPKKDVLDLSDLDIHEESRFEYRGIRYFAHRAVLV